MGVASGASLVRLTGPGVGRTAKCGVKTSFDVDTQSDNPGGECSDYNTIINTIIVSGAITLVRKCYLLEILSGVITLVGQCNLLEIIISGVMTLVGEVVLEEW